MVLRVALPGTEMWLSVQSMRLGSPPGMRRRRGENRDVPEHSRRARIGSERIQTGRVFGERREEQLVSSGQDLTEAE